MTGASAWRRQKVRLKRLLLRLGTSVRARLGLRHTTYVNERVDEYRRYWEDAATALGAEFEALTDSLWEIRRDGARTRISNYVTQLDDAVTLRIAGDKELVYHMADREGVPIPEHSVFSIDSFDVGAEFLRRAEQPCVVKPVRDTSSGLGVTTHVTGTRQLEWAVARASLFCPEVLVERVVPGESYRLLFLDGGMIHAVRRLGTRVRGDGGRTIRELTVDAYGERALDRIARATLDLQGLSPESVPAPGASVLVRGVPPETSRTKELRTVYDQEATSSIAPSLVEELRPLVSRVGASFCGVDVVTSDPSLPLRRSGGAFIEVNTTPGIHHHYVASDAGDRPGVAEAVLRRLLA